MKKRFAAILAATAIVGVTTAFAANPFSDVTPSDWAYQAVSQLAAAGIVNGYPDGTFKGQRNITRYEMAQMVAKAMAHEARANAEQQAMINQLADEFSSELNTLGVRVSNLEDRVGNVKLTGDARVKFAQTDKAREFKEDNKADSKVSDTAEREEEYSFRARLGVNAKVAEHTTAGARLVMEGDFGVKDDDYSKVTFDRLWIAQDFGVAQVKAGRMGLFLGQGLVYDDTFDGVVLATNLDKANLTVGYGYPMADAVADIKGVDHKTAVFGQVSMDVAKDVNLTGYYAKLSSSMEKVGGLGHDVYGVALDANVKGLWVGGEYAKRNEGKDLGANAKGLDAWTAGIGTSYGPASLKVQYYHEGVNSPIIATTGDQVMSKNWKGFVATLDYAVAKNVDFTFAYSFKGKLVDVSDVHTGDKAPTNAYYAQLQYSF